MNTTDLIPYLKGYLEGKETLDKYEVEFLKKILKDSFTPITTLPVNPWPTVTIPPNPTGPNPLIPQIWYSANGGTTQQ